MQYTDTLILAILQGLTEFLPISSSGHLVIGQKYLNINLPGNAFEVVLHLGTLMSVLMVFRGEIKTIIFNLSDSSNKYYISALVFGTVPALLVGILLKDSISLIFDDIVFVSISLIITGIMLITSKFIVIRNVKLTLLIGLIIGLAQAAAIIPGISRSGMVISSALMLGLNKEKSIQYCFFMVVPIIILSIVYELLFSSGFEAINIVDGIGLFVSSFIFGYFS